jgi:hypothetical protein
LIVNTEIEWDEEVIEKERTKLGRFVLASNDLEIDDETMHQNYKRAAVSRMSTPVKKCTDPAE